MQVPAGGKAQEKQFPFNHVFYSEKDEMNRKNKGTVMQMAVIYSPPVFFGEIMSGFQGSE